ncbi:zinc finger protein 117-like [Mus pahari]|uniref:zinc finger protein 117-like n=1 Tax=Mus pahari TaxID=10093 RepID=UPI001114AE8C|nr:zinc finger protein 117-like [Mus pahari]
MTTTLKTHQKVHTGEKPYKYRECDKCFTKWSHLQRHQSVHNQERPYKCKECGKSFTKCSTLQTHQKVHNVEKPYTSGNRLTEAWVVVLRAKAQVSRTCSGAEQAGRHRGESRWCRPGVRTQGGLRGGKARGSRGRRAGNPGGVCSAVAGTASLPPWILPGLTLITQTCLPVEHNKETWKVEREETVAKDPGMTNNFKAWFWCLVLVLLKKKSMALVRSIITPGPQVGYSFFLKEKLREEKRNRNG